ncbi:MAG: nitrite reductase small subunit NirD [Azospirillaceae bacterium]|nr:nitrite reductase small subunit NirD [Azospirillaceae bacterium]
MDSVGIENRWVDVGVVADIPRQGARVVATPRGDIAIFRTLDDAVFALYDRCPHKGGPLSQGTVHGHAVTCPLHNWVIDLDSGRAREPDEGCANRVPVRVQDSHILIQMVA